MSWYMLSEACYDLVSVPLQGVGGWVGGRVSEGVVSSHTHPFAGHMPRCGVEVPCKVPSIMLTIDPD